MTMYSDSPCLAAVFDIDGTLIDSMEDWRFAAERYLMSLGLPTNAVDTVQAFDSGGLRLVSKRIISTFRFRCLRSAEDIYKEYSELWYE